MKKHILLVAAILAFSFASNAQDTPTKSKTVKNKKAEALETEHKSKVEEGDKKTEEATLKTEEKAPEPKKKTRMAINEKGVPSNATKATEKK